MSSDPRHQSLYARAASFFAEPQRISIRAFDSDGARQATDETAAHAFLGELKEKARAVAKETAKISAVAAMAMAGAANAAPSMQPTEGVSQTGAGLSKDSPLLALIHPPQATIKMLPHQSFSERGPAVYWVQSTKESKGYCLMDLQNMPKVVGEVPSLMSAIQMQQLVVAHEVAHCEVREMAERAPPGTLKHAFDVTSRKARAALEVDKDIASAAGWDLAGPHAKKFGAAVSSLILERQADVAAVYYAAARVFDAASAPSAQAPASSAQLDRFDSYANALLAFRDHHSIDARDAGFNIHETSDLVRGAVAQVRELAQAGGSDFARFRKNVSTSEALNLQALEVATASVIQEGPEVAQRFVDGAGRASEALERDVQAKRKEELRIEAELEQKTARLKVLDERMAEFERQHPGWSDDIPTNLSLQESDRRYAILAEGREIEQQAVLERFRVQRQAEAQRIELGVHQSLAQEAKTEAAKLREVATAVGDSPLMQAAAWERITQSNTTLQSMHRAGLAAVPAGAVGPGGDDDDRPRMQAHR